MDARRRIGFGLALALSAVAACSGGGDAPERAGDAPATPVATDAPPVSTVAPVATEPPAVTEPPVTTTERDVDRDDWTFLVYVMGDNDLEPFAVDDLLEMSEVGSTDSVNIVALADRHPDYTIDEDALGDFDETKLLVINRGEFLEADPVGELNVGSPDTLAEFITFGLTEFPADHYAVVLWDHGGGWTGMGPDETDGNDILDLAEINAGFEAGLAAAGVDTVDLVGFDACLMATYEVATTMADHADYMLASEELEPGYGWNYLALQTLLDNPGTSTIELGQAIVDGYADTASGQDEDVTLSLVDLGAMATLEDALGELAVPLIADPTAAAPAMASAQAKSLGFGSNPDPSIDSFMVDLGEAVSALGAADPTLAEPAAGVLAALDQVVVVNLAGPAAQGATGLSIYFPPYADVFRQGYLFLEDIPVWPEVLQSFFTAGSEIPEDARAGFVDPDGAAGYFFDADGVNLVGTLAPGSESDIVEAEIFYGVLDESDDSIIFLGEEPAELLDDDSGQVVGLYDLTVMTISDGEDTEYAYQDISVDEEAGLATLDVPLWYIAPEDIDSDEPPQDVLLSLVIDLDSEDVSETYYVVGEAGTVGELTADPEGLIFPVVLNVYPDGSQEWIPTTERGLFADLLGLEYDFESLEPGTQLYAELVVRDYGGNTSAVSMFDVIPG